MSQGERLDGSFAGCDCALGRSGQLGLADGDLEIEYQPLVLKLLEAGHSEWEIGVGEGRAKLEPCDEMIFAMTPVI